MYLMMQIYLQVFKLIYLFVNIFVIVVEDYCVRVVVQVEEIFSMVNMLDLIRDIIFRRGLVSIKSMDWIIMKRKYWSF